VNARVWTGDPSRPFAQALAIRGERLAAVGTSDEAGALASPATRVVDARGRTVLPGFVDAHFHVLNLVDREPPLGAHFVASRREMADLVAEAVARARRGQWIVGDGWDERKWGGAPPTRQWLDAAAPHHPVWLVRAGGAAGLANSAALRAVGLDPAAPADEPGVVRDAAGRPTGLLRGGAMLRVDEALVEPERAQAERDAVAVMDSLLRLGVTSIHHSGNWKELLVLRGLRGDGRLAVRVYAATPLPAWERLRDEVARRGRGDEWLRWHGLKLFQSRWTSRPPATTNGRLDRYAVQPSADEAYGWFLGATRAGLQIMVHAGGIEHLRFMERVRGEPGAGDPRFRIEHAHDVPPEERALYARAGVIASVQPALLWHHDARTRAGAPAARSLFPCREFVDLGVRLAFGTDAITASRLTSPFESIRVALERPGPDGRRLTLEQCLRAHTIDAAYAGFAERDTGSLEPGKLADFVLLDRDLFTSDAAALGSTRVLLTAVGGRIAYEAR
jgi:predicted amidohydrolase YtcJ